MNKGRSQFTPALSLSTNVLETRIVLSEISPASAIHQSAVQVAARTARAAKTQTSIAVSAGTLGQPVTFRVTVRAPASAGSPQGAVKIVDHGAVIQSLTLSPTSSMNSKFALSNATYTLTQPPGGAAYFFGKHTVSATFIPAGAFSKSRVNKSFAVSKPAYTTLAGGVKIATITQGSGPEIQPGQTASVRYTGYLSKNGHIFDDSLNHGGAPISFPLGTGQVIPGFDAGATGMQVGETRIVLIPPAEGYGNQANGPIPAHSTLIFVLTLDQIE
jgi:FKBP-type peptidyl-prolyl cis-trans isomerase FkpA